MGPRFSRKNVILGLVFLTCSSFFLAFYTPAQDTCNCADRSLNNDASRSDDHEWGPHKLAILVPFRNRFEELMEFVPWMQKFLNKQQVRHRIFVLNQADSLRFNRAALINVGFLQSRLECDYIVMHDVDLLPNNIDLNYTYPERGPMHLAAPELHPLYHYPTFVGGILLVNNKHFHDLNGLSNKFWGWGREDDEFYLRIQEAGLKVYRPKGIKTTSANTFTHLHDKYQHPRDYTRYGQQRKMSKRDYFTGVDTIQYGLISRKELTIDGTPVTILNIKLECDIEDTPWCMSPDQLETQLNSIASKDPDRAELLKDKLFGENGLLIPPKATPKKTKPKEHKT